MINNNRYEVFNARKEVKKSGKQAKKQVRKGMPKVEFVRHESVVGRDKRNMLNVFEILVDVSVIRIVQSKTGTIHKVSIVKGFGIGYESKKQSLKDVLQHLNFDAEEIKEIKKAIRRIKSEYLAKLK